MKIRENTMLKNKIFSTIYFRAFLMDFIDFGMALGGPGALKNE